MHEDKINAELIDYKFEQLEKDVQQIKEAIMTISDAMRTFAVLEVQKKQQDDAIHRLNSDIEDLKKWKLSIEKKAWLLNLGERAVMIAFGAVITALIALVI